MDRRKLLIILFSLGFFFLALIVFCAMMRHSGISMPDWLISLGTIGLIADVLYICTLFKYAKWIQVVYALLFLLIGAFSVVTAVRMHKNWIIAVVVLGIVISIVKFIKLIRDESE